LPSVIAALAGGVGAARFLAGLVRAVPPEDVVAIVNTGDDDEVLGLHVSPDLDSVMYTLAGASDSVQGWGRAGETFRTLDELARLGEPTWFRLGDLDLATHLARTRRIRTGATLSDVTAHLTRAWGLDTRLLPMSDEPVRTRLTVRAAVGTVELAMQEWFVRERCEPEVTAVDFAGADAAKPAPGVLDALERAHVICVCPSNPVISIGPILAVAGVRERLVERRERVIAISPIIAGKTVKGPADRLMAALGIEVSAVGVAAHYAPWCATLVVDAQDAALVPRIEALGVRAIVTDTLMRSPDVAAALARATLAAVA
jgi:LPPG:FO 2-phospho-L-lactate transferase